MSKGLADFLSLFPTHEHFLAARDIEREHAVLRFVAALAADPMRRMVTVAALTNELWPVGRDVYNITGRDAVMRVINRTWKVLDDRGLIEAPDSTNGASGFRIPSEAGLDALSKAGFAAAKVRSGFTRDMFHPALPDAAWNAFRADDYDTAVFEAFKAVENAVLKKGLGKNGIAQGDHGVSLMRAAFDPNAGPLTDMNAKEGRRQRRCELFTGAMGELRNPKAHGDTKITDPLEAVEEMMTAGALLRIVDKA